MTSLDINSHKFIVCHNIHKFTIFTWLALEILFTYKLWYLTVAVPNTSITNYAIVYTPTPAIYQIRGSGVKARKWPEKHVGRFCLPSQIGFLAK